MADNYTAKDASASNITVAADDISSVYYPRVKITQGADGSSTDVSSSAPLQVTLANTGANTTAVKVDGSAVTQPISGTVTANAGSGTMAVSASSLPLPTGASTAAKQPALGTAGTASADVITVQGITSMTPLSSNLFVGGSAVSTANPVAIQPPASGSLTVSGTVSAAQSGTWTVQPGNTANTTAWKVDASSVAVPVTDNSGSLTVDGTVAATQSGTWNVGTLTTVTNPVTTVHGITGIAHGVKTVTTAGTDEALATSTACKKVVIQAQTDNTGWIAVGTSGVDATVATGTGVSLGAGDAFEIEIDNLADVYIDSTVNGDGVRYTYFT